MQLAFQYQAVAGAVDISTTPVVEYTYSSPANGSRITSMVYPNGRTIDFNYSGTNPNSTLDNAIGRLDSISDGANSGDAGQVLHRAVSGLSILKTSRRWIGTKCFHLRIADLSQPRHSSKIREQ